MKMMYYIALIVPTLIMFCMPNYSYGQDENPTIVVSTAVHTVDCPENKICANPTMVASTEIPLTEETLSHSNGVLVTLTLTGGPTFGREWSIERNLKIFGIPYTINEGLPDNSRVRIYNLERVSRTEVILHLHLEDNIDTDDTFTIN